MHHAEALIHYEGLLINEVMVSNEAVPVFGGYYTDWIELKNASDQPLNLDGYSLSRKSEEPLQYRLPGQTLAPGELLLLGCSGTTPSWVPDTGFSLDAISENLFLFAPSGELLDYAALKDIPIDGSMGRMQGRRGWFYFASPTPGAENTEGKRRVSEAPVCLSEEGPYEDTEEITVLLQAEGEIRYTLDGSLPNRDSLLYQDGIRLRKTAVVRAVAIEENALPSRAASFSFFLNEHHTLPILSLAVDDAWQFQQMYNVGNKIRTVSCTLALFENGLRFRQSGELSIKGWTSLHLPKKSMAVTFRDRYGGNLLCDVFENGVTDYHSLALRVGQDHNFTVFRSELFQDLCREYSDHLLTQESKACVLYVGGEYYGIYFLKDEVNDELYAHVAGVPPESVESFKTPAAMGTEYYQTAVDFGWHADMTQEENYARICEEIDIDSLIDWFLFEGYSTNSDTASNLRICRSHEADNRWTYVYYDLDWAMHYWWGSFRIILDKLGNTGGEEPNLLRNLLKNPEFRERVLTRYSELTKNAFTDEELLRRIDAYTDLLMPELPRDRERWHLKMSSFEDQIKVLKESIVNNHYTEYSTDQLCTLLKVTDEEREYYFG